MLCGKRIRALLVNPVRVIIEGSITSLRIYLLSTFRSPRIGIELASIICISLLIAFSPTPAPALSNASEWV